MNYNHWSVSVSLSLSRSPLRFFPLWPCAHSVDITFSLSFLIFLLIWQWFCFFFFHKIRNIARALNGFYSTSDLIYCMFTEKRQVLSLKERKKSQKMLRWYYSLELCVGYGAIFPMYPPRIDTFMLRFRFSICNFFQRQFQLQLKIHRMRENLSIFKSI